MSPSARTRREEGRRRFPVRVLPLLATALVALVPATAPAEPAAGAATAAFRAAVRPLPSSMAARLQDGGFWHRGCPVALSGLRLLTLTHRGFDGRSHTGELIVNQSATGALTSAFRALYQRGFPIRHM